MIFVRKGRLAAYIWKKRVNITPEPPPDFIPTRASLLARLKDRSDQASWKTFFDTYWGLIYHSAIKAGLNDMEAQDVVQETVLAVLQHMPRFQYDPRVGSFKNWLLQQTKWRIGDQFRKRMPPAARLPRRTDPERPTDDETEFFPAGVSGSHFDRIWDEEWERNLFAVAIERVKQRVNLKHYQVFDLCALRGWGGGRVAAFLNISLPSVYIIKHRVARLLRMEIESLRKKPL